MKTSYNKMLFVKELEKAKVTIYMTEGLKWESIGHEEPIEYTGLVSWDIIEGGADAEEIEICIDEEMTDEMHEYLVLHFNDGSEATFRNSHTIMFIQ